MDWSNLIDHTQGIYEGKIDMASKVNDDRLIVNMIDREVVHKRGNTDRPFIK